MWSRPWSTATVKTQIACFELYTILFIPDYFSPANRALATFLAIKKTTREMQSLTKAAPLLSRRHLLFDFSPATDLCRFVIPACYPLIGSSVTWTRIVTWPPLPGSSRIIDHEALQEVCYVF